MHYGAKKLNQMVNKKKDAWRVIGFLTGKIEYPKGQFTREKKEKKDSLLTQGASDTLSREVTL